MVGYFFDTFTLVEIVRNNPSYIKFIGENITTTRFNMTELVYIIMNEQGEETAKTVFDKFRGSEVDVTDEVLINAMKFRLENKKKNLSYTDCIGYVYALKNGLKFLTGDTAFEGMKNVEFVEKERT